MIRTISECLNFILFAFCLFLAYSVWDAYRTTEGIGRLGLVFGDIILAGALLFTSIWALLNYKFGLKETKEAELSLLRAIRAVNRFQCVLFPPAAIYGTGFFIRLLIQEHG